MLGFTQMIPNASKLKADSNYMNAMSAVENKKLYHQSIEFLAKPLLPMDSIG
jgi:hypothetical protein